MKSFALDSGHYSMIRFLVAFFLSFVTADFCSSFKSCTRCKEFKRYWNETVSESCDWCISTMSCVQSKTMSTCKSIDAKFVCCDDKSSEDVCEAAIGCKWCSYQADVAPICQWRDQVECKIVLPFVKTQTGILTIVGSTLGGVICCFCLFYYVIGKHATRPLRSLRASLGFKTSPLTDLSNNNNDTHTIQHSTNDLRRLRREELEPIIQDLT